MGAICQKKGERCKMASARTLLASLAAIVIMIFGYFVGGSILYGNVVTGAAQIPGLTLEGVIGTILFYVIGFAFEAAKLPKLIANLKATR